jgi:hypothetical protein
MNTVKLSGRQLVSNSRWDAKPITKWFTIALTSLVGGFLAFLLITAIPQTKPLPPSDAVAVANTFIVFTTIIFVATTLVIAMIGYIFVQQFSQSKEQQTKTLYLELQQRFETDANSSIDFVKIILKNDEVLRFVEQRFQEKIEELLRGNLTRKQDEVDAIKGLAAQVGQNGSTR